MLKRKDTSMAYAHCDIDVGDDQLCRIAKWLAIMLIEKGFYSTKIVRDSLDRIVVTSRQQSHRWEQPLTIQQRWSAYLWRSLKPAAVQPFLDSFVAHWCDLRELAMQKGPPDAQT